MGIDTSEKLRRIKLEFSDCQYRCPIDYAPILQKAKTKLPISKISKFLEHKAYIQRVVKDSSSFKNINEMLSYYSTHTEGTILYVSQVGIVKEMLRRTKVNGQSILELILVGHSTTSEELVILSPDRKSVV